MQFKIVEDIRKHNNWDSLQGVLIGLFKFFFIIVIIPFILLAILISIFKNKNENKNTGVEDSEWIEFYSNKNLKLRRLFIDEYELPDYLDYPEEIGDLYLFRVKSEPHIEELADKFIDFQFQEDENGIYLLSFNKKKEGMTLWYINSENLKLEKVKDLQSSWWNFGKKEEKIVLTTRYQKEDIRIEVENNNYIK